MPELVVNIMASISGNSGLAVGNIVGSNTINIFVVIGIAAFIKPINVQSTTVRIEIPFSLLAAIILLVLVNDKLIDGAAESFLSRSDGLILLLFLTIFLYYTFLSAKSDKFAPVSDVKIRKGYLSVLMITGGIVGLYFGGKLIVDSATTIAQSFGISDSLIGLTVIAIGTSLPELVTSAVAAYKGNSDIAIGNVLGSNIFNIFMVLGLSSTIRPLPLYAGSNVDIMVTCLASLLLFTFALAGPGQKIDRKEGALFVSIYIAYIIYLIAFAQ
jgi:cation:H+ antiporter